MSSNKKPTAKERLNETMHEMALSLYDINAMDAVTLREYENLNMPQVHELTPEEIKQLRLREHVSQSVFAKSLNTTVHTVREWEQGKKHPRGTSLKLLNLVEKRGLSVLR